MQFIISVLALSITVLIGVVINRMHNGGSLFEKNNYIVMDDNNKTKVKKTSNIFMGVIIMLAILILFITSINTYNNQEDKININTATVRQLIYLDGIGEVKASRIIEHRPYNEINELLNIVGETTYDKIKKKVFIGKNQNKVLK